ncbi:type II toxin-antitoxin system RelE/ParE family toxin [Bowmanella denitrificans]|uniref:type II toxin-antitoxin system RelE/ParE family toxin n=1 Tax=Bowmanella denitrificans TaxID=366582 RepID=UPI000C9CD9EA|nr:type II toxin-antitoxin system RelE/ParE family toxin [Bowmanella denitrificans]
MLPLVFHPDVKTEIFHSFQWYQEQSLGLGHEFINELEESFSSIQSLPFTWPKMGQCHRRFVLSRFPFSIIYKVQGSKVIYVIAVMHNHRKPGYWLER